MLSDTSWYERVSSPLLSPNAIIDDIIFKSPISIMSDFIMNSIIMLMGELNNMSSVMASSYKRGDDTLLYQEVKDNDESWSLVNMHHAPT